jgi:hypothetical protein
MQHLHVAKEKEVRPRAVNRYQNHIVVFLQLLLQVLLHRALIHKQATQQMSKGLIEKPNKGFSAHRSDR